MTTITLPNPQTQKPEIFYLCKEDDGNWNWLTVEGTPMADVFQTKAYLKSLDAAQMIKLATLMYPVISQGRLYFIRFLGGKVDRFTVESIPCGDALEAIVENIATIRKQFPCPLPIQSPEHEAVV